MQITVRNILESFRKDVLERLCWLRELDSGGTKSVLLQRLVYHYRGNLADVVHDLRKEDLMELTSALSDRVEFPRNLRALRVAEFQEVCLFSIENCDEDSKANDELQITVRNLIEPFLKDELKRLCWVREIPDTGTKPDLLQRLVYHYRGNLANVVYDLRKEDLLVMASALSDQVEFPTNLRALRIAELQKICLSAITGRHLDFAHSDDRSKELVQGELNPDTGSEDRQFNVELYANVSDGSPPVARFSADKLAESARGANSVTIYSAYYITTEVEKIAKQCRGEVKIVLNGLGGRRLKKQIEELQELQDDLSESNELVEIKLALAKGLFHTKLYLFGEEEAWIGSANATRAGLNGGNEEVLLKLSPIPDSLTRYADSVWSRAKSLDCYQDKVNSLFAFFRSGQLYYEPYAQLQLTVNPFRELLNALPTHERSKLRRDVFESPYAVDEAGLGAFSIGKLFQAMTSEDLPEESSGRRPSVQLRSKAIETCYGYWVMEPLIEEVDDEMKVAGEAIRGRLDALFDFLSSEQHTIVQAYEEYLGHAHNTLMNQRVDWKAYSQNSNLFEDTSLMERRLGHLITELRDDTSFERHCQVYAKSEVPQIWEDHESSTSFERSFFESLSKVSFARRRTGSAKWILDSLDISESTAEEIRDQLEEALADEDSDWYEWMIEE